MALTQTWDLMREWEERLEEEVSSLLENNGTVY